MLANKGRRPASVIPEMILYFTFAIREEILGARQDVVATCLRFLLDVLTRNRCGTLER